MKKFIVILLSVFFYGTAQGQINLNPQINEAELTSLKKEFQELYRQKNVDGAVEKGVKVAEMLTETRNLKEVEEALATRAVDIIMLDNMSLFEMAAAVQLIDGATKTEASGGITKESVRVIAETGVDYISSGAIIYSAPNIDLSLKAF